MPTREQLQQIWATEFAFPETRRSDDPAYRKPEIIQTTMTDNERLYYNGMQALQTALNDIDAILLNRAQEMGLTSLPEGRSDLLTLLLCPASPSPVEAREYWDSVYKHTLADKDFLVPAWVLDFADKYAANIKATPPASSGETMRWVWCRDGLPKEIGWYCLRNNVPDGFQWFDGKTFIHNNEPMVLNPLARWLNEFASASPSDTREPDEKEVMIRAFVKVSQIFEGRKWIMEGRGAYPYNDDRYKEEVRYMFDEFDALEKDTWANIRSKSVDYRKQIIDQYLKETDTKEDAIKFAEWLWRNRWFSYENGFWNYTFEQGTAMSEKAYNKNYRKTTAQLYDLYTQSLNK